MDYIQIAFIVVISLFIVWKFMRVKGIENITTQEAKNKFKDKNIQFIDVRTPGEYKANHKKPFKNIPLQQLHARLNELDPNKEVVVICQSGMRSMQASKILKKKGFEKVANVKGGMSTFR
ncbi:rhodanese-like domain-containing protein [Bacillaceae bacterium W0354]